MSKDELLKCFQTLELESHVSLHEVKQAYREMVKVWHPDRFQSDSNLERKAQEKLKAINSAYERLQVFYTQEAERNVTEPSQTDKSSTNIKENADVLFKRGWRYDTGDGVRQDHFEAAKWYQISAEQGDERAQFNLALMYEHGRGVVKDAVQAAKWYERAATKGFIQAQVNLALMYQAGRGVPPNPTQAAKWSSEAATRGEKIAQLLLGHLYYRGEGVPKDVSEAAKWWTKSAEQLNAEAQYALGCLHHRGHTSSLVAKFVSGSVGWKVGDAKIEAFKWLNLAITYGAGQKAGLAREQVSTCLSETQRNEARNRAAAFYPKYPKASSQEILSQLFDWYIEEGKSAPYKEMRDTYSKINSKCGGMENFREEVCTRALEHLKNTFLSDSLTKTSELFKTIGAAWNSERSAEHWGRQIGQSILEFPYDYLSDVFIQRRENAINQLWLKLVKADRV